MSSKKIRQRVIDSVISFHLIGWFFVLYLFGGCVYAILLACIGKIAPMNSFYVTLGLITGSDPYGLRDVAFKGTDASAGNPMETVWVIWSGAWVLHIASWLVIPALVGIVLASALEKMKHERDIEDKATMTAFLHNAYKELIAKRMPVEGEPTPQMQADFLTLIDGLVETIAETEATKIRIRNEEEALHEPQSE